jgi:hypothetical protein
MNILQGVGAHPNFMKVTPVYKALQGKGMHPVTIRLRTNVLIRSDVDCLKQQVRAILAGKAKKGRLPRLRDGNAAGRVAEMIAAALRRNSHRSRSIS